MNIYNADLLHRLIEEANLLIAYIDINYRVLICNKKFQDIIGQPKENILGNDILEVLCPNNSAKYQIFKAFIETSLSYAKNNYYEDVVSKDGQEIFILWSFSPIMSKDNIAEGVLCMGYDATAIRNREVSVDKIDESLKDITSSIKDYALYATNLQRNIIYYSVGAELIFGWSRDEIALKNVSILHKPEDSNKISSILKIVQEDGKCELEIDMRRKDGHVFPADLVVNQLLNEANDLIGFLFIAKDITETKKMEEQIIRSEKLAFIGQMAAGIAHDIGNPLYIISVQTELLLNTQNSLEETRKMLESIKCQSGRINDLVKRLLKFSKPSKEKTSAININELIEGVLPFLNYQKSIDKIKIVKDFNSCLPSVVGDVTQLQEVFVNLFLNACQAMENGGTLAVHTKKLDDFIEIQVHDTGSGIPDDIMNKLFIPFNSAKKEGTGLGLAICYNIIRNHNGRIEAKTQTGKGTTFNILLPVGQ